MPVHPFAGLFLGQDEQLVSSRYASGPLLPQEQKQECTGELTSSKL